LLLLGRDVDAMKTKVGIERVVVDVFRLLSLQPSRFEKLTSR
jgi:hypothetical protein